MRGYIGVGGIPNVVVQMFEAHFWSHVIVDVQDGVDDVTSEQATGAESVELWVGEAMLIAYVAI